MELRRDMRDSRKPYERRERAQARLRLPEYNLNIELIELVGVLNVMTWVLNNIINPLRIVYTPKFQGNFFLKKNKVNFLKLVNSRLKSIKAF